MSAKHSNKKRPAVERFLEKILKTESCWLWTAAKNIRGYGVFAPNHKTMPAHRFSWQYFKGMIPDGMFVLHTCDNPPCVNPDHLWLGTDASNAADRNAKNRQAKGGRHGRAKLTEDIVRICRTRIALKSASIKSLAKEFSVSWIAMSQAIDGTHWKHVS